MGYQVDSGSDLETFGQAIATHPGFAAGWAQKLCFFANSKACTPSDPEFKRVEKAFIDSNFDFKTLVVELFSSPLITAQERTKTHDLTEYGPLHHPPHAPVSCPKRALGRRWDAGLRCLRWQKPHGHGDPRRRLESRRHGALPACDLLALLLRHRRDLLHPLCQGTSSTKSSPPLTPARQKPWEKSLEFVVTGLMGLPPTDSRHDQVKALIQEHYDQSFAKTKATVQSLRSVTTLGCMSPFLSSVEF